jgi:phospholipase C
VPGLGNAIMSASAMAATRAPDSLPDPTRPAGTTTAAMPFDHVVCVMMENHSFDNLLGVLPRLGQPNADGLTFNRAGQATNTNPSSNGTVSSYELTNTEQPGSVDQSWNATHQQIDGGKMDGFVASVNSTEPMGYWTDEVLPFAYSLARTFCCANRWFCSAPCQTYPNRRFLMAGTAYGNVSFVDPEFGVLSDIGAPLASLPQVATQPTVAEVLQNVNGLGGDQESPQDMYYGEAWAYRILEAVLQSPAWSRTLLIYTYDEQGGYYDHVPPPAAIAPDSIPPTLSPSDAPGGYTLFGPGVPGIVVSPYSALLQTWVPLITGSPAFKKDGLLEITFDESDGPQADASACCCEQPGPGDSPLPGITGPGGGLVGAVLLSPFIAPGTVSATPYNHYSSLASWETLFGVSRLADAATVPATFGSDIFTAAGR